MLCEDFIRDIAIQGDSTVTPVTYAVESGVTRPISEQFADFDRYITDFAFLHEKAQSCESSMIL
jgi:hypothetical protein